MFEAAFFRCQPIHYQCASIQSYIVILREKGYREASRGLLSLRTAESRAKFHKLAALRHDLLLGELKE